MSEPEPKTEQTVTLLPQYEDINAENDVMFTLNDTKGLSLKLGGKGKFDVNYSIGGALRPTKVAIVPQVNGEFSILSLPIRSLYLSLLKSFPKCSITSTLSSDMVDLSAIVNPTPFAIGKAGFLTNFQMWNAYAFAIFRQPWSNYCVSFSTSELKKPELQSASAVIGHPNINFGIQYTPQDPAAKLSLMCYANIKSYKFHMASNIMNYKARLVKTINPQLSVGLQVRVNRMPAFVAADLSWIYTNKDTQVHSIISTNGDVFSELSRKLNEKVALNVNCCLNHLEADYSFGIDLSINQ
ncbi:hypothetical protein TVAG_123100 [Trichomonas vaginalis G3]|uniref:Uncharacterized protein n=1 Tax=Trichomonas vaginalis (strain ATCC PRA-98 / G3) TaxID=412133 RepID=A2FH81_TRIV3|nr:porin domain-containing protein [Trichomonas vaginalis G3]EAX95719.1 hypothetical protein TVAG_123100 [Trichomonas vaginalis G3]KAI5549322.1 porin domain-containing protein [Trichomonas vaginalis G3]|eukprot:XP_001308649.1 hypothetical protein [Trichomonas vaginalis G3]